MAGSVGFGSGEDARGPSGINVSQPVGTADDQIADDIHQIRQKYVNGATNYRVPLQLLASGGSKVDLTGQEVNAIIVTAVAGVIYGYLGDQSTQFGQTALPPDFAVSAGVVPTTLQIVVPQRNDYVISFQEGTGMAIATGTARICKL